MYNLKCPWCGHKAMCHAGENGISICMGSLKCSCTISAASLYAAECERLADINADLQASVHRYAGYADTHLAERDAARAECRRWTDCAEQALVARDRYKAALNNIAYAAMDIKDIARTALDAGEDK